MDRRMRKSSTWKRINKNKLTPGKSAIPGNQNAYFLKKILPNEIFLNK